jgi:hypothetical protein
MDVMRVDEARKGIVAPLTLFAFHNQQVPITINSPQVAGSYRL